MQVYEGDVKSASKSPLLEIMPGLLAKFECYNAGGSHKVRAARKIIAAGRSEGKIVPGRTTIIEKTGGNFGFGLAVACREFRVPVELAIGLSFSQVKRDYLRFLGARLIGVDMLAAGASPREVVEWHLSNAAALGKHYFYTDQFNNPNSVVAHEMETGPEILGQLSAWPDVKRLVFVSCAGTGATLTGVSRALRKAGYDVSVVLVEPEGCDSRNGVFVQHRLEGMAVGVTPPFVDWGDISAVVRVTDEEVVGCQRDFARSHGHFVGNTAAACLSAGIKLADGSRSTKVVVLLYDHGLWYFAPRADG